MLVLATRLARNMLGRQAFLDTNMLILVTRKSRVGGIAQCELPTQMVLQWNIGSRVSGGTDFSVITCYHLQRQVADCNCGLPVLIKGCTL